MVRFPIGAALFLLVAVPAAAQQPVQLQFQEGLVTLRAQNAPARAILAEWARLGGATIVNGERVAGPPLTLELAGVPERQALDIVLRSVAGYMLAPRRAGGTGASAFDRIMILPTSVAPVAPPPTTAAARPGALPRPPIARPPAPPPPPLPDPDLADDPPDMDDPDSAAAPVDTAVPAPPQPRAIPRPLVPPPMITPFGAPGAAGVPEQQDPESAQPPSGVAPTPGNPFGVPAGSSATPGVIAPAPRPQQQPAIRVQ